MPQTPQTLQLPCSWCETVNRDLERSSCVNCGGPLPALPPAPGETPTRPPPPAPRDIPATYRNRVLLWKNVGVWIGLMFTVFFCWTLIFPLIGLPVGLFAYRRARARLEALERGEAAPAELLSVAYDPSVTINGRHPLRIDYSFVTAQGELIEGWEHTWRLQHRKRSPGELFWIVYLPEDPRRNAVWPPVN